MPIDIEKVLGAELEPTRSSWTRDNVILYHLGLGSGATARDLRYVYEDALVTLPTYGVIPVSGLLDGLGSLPGFDADPAMLLHGEQESSLPGPLPVEATVVNTGRVAEIYDKGSAALVILETESRDETTGDLLCTNRFSLFFRGEGGFGGDSGPKAGPAAPDRPADQVLRVLTLPQLAAIYRLSGDRNPLHVDPAFAKRGGFDTPILHGLCTFGVVCKALVDDVLGGALDQVRRYRARFAGVLLPGETLAVEVWQEPGHLAVRATCEERGSAVLSHVVLDLAG
jgi:acyl dehydratase